MKHESCTLLLSSSCRVWSGIRKSESIEAIYSGARTVVSVCHPINSGYRPFTFYTNPHFSKHWHLKCILFGAMPLFVAPKNYRNGHARRDKTPLKRGRNHIVKMQCSKAIGQYFLYQFPKAKKYVKSVRESLSQSCMGKFADSPISPIFPWISQFMRQKGGVCAHKENK